MMENRVALVTGGSRGIGKSICLELAKAGYDIVTCYTSKSAEAEETVAACKTFGVNAVAYQANVANEADVTELFAQLKAQFGRIDVPEKAKMQDYKNILAFSFNDYS